MRWTKFYLLGMLADARSHFANSVLELMLRHSKNDLQDINPPMK